jgi:hypothetical protein
MSVGKNTGRFALRFPDEVRRNFSFLESIGFRCVHSEATLVRYEAPTTNIYVYHGRQSYEIGAELEFVNEPNERYSFSEVLRVVDPQRGETYRNYSTHTREGVAKGVRELANELQKCFETGVLRNQQLISCLKLQRKNLASKLAIKSQLLQARIKSESAWAERDFKKVVQILSPFEEYLSLPELKKLEYSRQHV